MFYRLKNILIFFKKMSIFVDFINQNNITLNPHINCESPLKQTKRKKILKIGHVSAKTLIPHVVKRENLYIYIYIRIRYKKTNLYYYLRSDFAYLSHFP